MKTTKSFATKKEARRYLIIKYLIVLLVLAILCGLAFYLGAKLG